MFLIQCLVRFHLLTFLSTLFNLLGLRIWSYNFYRCYLTLRKLKSLGHQCYATFHVWVPTSLVLPYTFPSQSIFCNWLNFSISIWVVDKFNLGRVRCLPSCSRGVLSVLKCWDWIVAQSCWVKCLWLVHRGFSCQDC